MLSADQPSGAPFDTARLCRSVAFGGLCYCVGSFAYQAGYTKTPNGRNQGLGPIKYIGFFTSLGVAIKMSISMI